MGAPGFDPFAPPPGSSGEFSPGGAEASQPNGENGGHETNTETNGTETNGEAGDTGGNGHDGGGSWSRLRTFSRVQVAAMVERLRRLAGRRQESQSPLRDAIFARRSSGARFSTVNPGERTVPEICFDLPPGVQEEYERIRANLLGATHSAEARVLAIAASLSGEGATTSSVLLGMTFAQDAPTVLIDANLRTPALGKIFHAEGAHGLTDLLTNGVPLAACVRETSIPNLHVLPGGITKIRPQLLLRSPRLPAILTELKERFTYVIFDCAPLNSYSEGIYLARQVDGVVMVVHAETTPIEVAYLAKMQVERSGARVLGALLTKKREYLPEALSKRL
jgi:capsular exopolysaccharide synthesis family protein